MIDWIWIALMIGIVVSVWPRKMSRKLISVRAMHLDPLTWNRFCHLAIVKGMTQPELLGEAVIYYLDQRVK